MTERFFASFYRGFHLPRGMGEPDLTPPGANGLLWGPGPKDPIHWGQRMVHGTSRDPDQMGLHLDDIHPVVQIKSLGPVPAEWQDRARNFLAYYDQDRVADMLGLGRTEASATLEKAWDQLMG